MKLVALFLGVVVTAIVGVVGGALLWKANQKTISPPTAHVGSPTTEEWKKFDSAEGEFSVRFPGVPSKEKLDLMKLFDPGGSSGRASEITVFSVELERELYSVMYMDLSNFAGAEACGEKLEIAEGQGQTAQAISDFRARLSQSGTSLDGHPGIECSVEMDGDIATFRSYLVRERLYTLQAKTPKGDSPSVSKFLDSFRLLKT